MGVNYIAVFKIFTLLENKFEEACNLWVGKNLNLNFSCNDVAWNLNDGNLTIYFNYHIYLERNKCLNFFWFMSQSYLYIFNLVNLLNIILCVKYIKKFYIYIYYIRLPFRLQYYFIL